MLRECRCGLIYAVECPECGERGQVEYLNSGDLHLCACGKTFDADEGGTRPGACADCLAKQIVPGPRLVVTA